MTYRHYLQDAVFLVGLESEDTALLQELETALKYPVYPLYLGRRSCPPTLPLCLGIRAGKLLDTLRAEPLLVKQRNGAPLHIVADADPADAAAVPRRDPGGVVQSHPPAVRLPPSAGVEHKPAGNARRDRT